MLYAFALGFQGIFFFPHRIGPGVVLATEWPFWLVISESPVSTRGVASSTALSSCSIYLISPSGDEEREQWGWAFQNHLIRFKEQTGKHLCGSGWRYHSCQFGHQTPILKQKSKPQQAVAFSQEKSIQSSKALFIQSCLIIINVDRAPLIW